MLFLSTTFILGLLFVIPLASAEPKLPEDLPEVSQAPFKTKMIQHGNLIAFVKPLYTTFGDPAAYVTTDPKYDGVAKLILTLNTKPFPISVGCSGALISETHILTAAHCVTNEKNGKLILSEGTAVFPGKDPIPLIVSETVVHPDWNYDILSGNDVAILKLKDPINDIQPYGLDDTNTDDLNIASKAGYGRSGNGTQGDVLAFGTLRDGTNQYDDFADTMLDALGEQGYVPQSVLQYDFDNGTPQNDAFGFFFGLPDIGIGFDEVNSAPGDSGGPSFNDAGYITGITSYGISLRYIGGASSDIDDDLNSTFGEFAGDTRVSSYYEYISSVITGGPVNPPTDEDEPACPPAKAARNKC